MTDETYHRINAEMARLESQYDPYEDEQHRIAFGDGFTAYLGSEGFTWDDFLEAVELRKEQHARNDHELQEQRRS